ncbi:MAG: DUF924 family protein [Aestuariivirga sp.]
MNKPLNINVAGASRLAVPANAEAVVELWREAGPSLWFAKDPDFAARLRNRFLPLYDGAANGMFDHWLNAPESALALVVLLGQFPRHVFRGTPHMNVSDFRAREAAAKAIANGFDRMVETDLAIFFYLPLAYSENQSDQNRAVMLCERMGEPQSAAVKRRRDAIRRLGRRGS